MTTPRHGSRHRPKVAALARRGTMMLCLSKQVEDPVIHLDGVCLLPSMMANELLRIHFDILHCKSSI